MMQKDMKKLIAYSSVSHLGFCTLGIFALTPNGLSGSVIQQINHGISTGALFLLIGVLYERRHTRLISEFGGLSTPMPNFAAIYMIATLSSLGLPLLNGFIGEFTILSGIYRGEHRATRPGPSIGIVLGAAYLLWLYQRVMFGPVTNPANEHLPDLNVREYATLIPLVILCVLDRHLSQAALHACSSACAADRGAGESRITTDARASRRPSTRQRAASSAAAATLPAPPEHETCAGEGCRRLGSKHLALASSGAANDLGSRGESLSHAL